MNMDIIDEYYYGVRIFPGQDPSQVKNKDKVAFILVKSNRSTTQQAVTQCVCLGYLLISCFCAVTTVSGLLQLETV